MEQLDRFVPALGADADFLRAFRPGDILAGLAQAFQQAVVTAAVEQQVEPREVHGYAPAARAISDLAAGGLELARPAALVREMSPGVGLFR